MRPHALMLVLVLAAPLHADVIDFDRDAAGDALADNVTLAAQYTAKGVTFSIVHTNADVAARITGDTRYLGTLASVTDLTLTRSAAGGGYDPAFGNILHSYTGWGTESGDPCFAVDFAAPVSSVSVTFIGDSTGASMIFAYSKGLLVGFVRPDATPQGVADTAQFSLASGIDKLVVVPGSFYDWAGVGAIAFTSIPTPAGAAVLGLVGLAAVRRRSSER